MPDDGSWGLNELQFLAKQSGLGNLKINSGNRTSTGVVASITPGAGKTFTLYKANCSISANGIPSNALTQVDLRNNGTTIDSKLNQPATQAGTGFSESMMSSDKEYAIKGDQLVGDGVKTYDLNVVSISTNTIIQGTIEGYVQ